MIKVYINFNNDVQLVELPDGSTVAQLKELVHGGFATPAILSCYAVSYPPFGDLQSVDPVPDNSTRHAPVFVSTRSSPMLGTQDFKLTTLQELLQATRYKTYALPRDYLKNIEGNQPVPVDGNNMIIMVPGWLKTSLPKCSFPQSDKSLVDLSLPVPSNPFYSAMLQSASGAKMIKDLARYTDWSSTKSHVLLIGSSGCGKTSAVLALAPRRFLIFLECPSEKVAPGSEAGFRMDKATWTTAVSTYAQAENSFFTEVAARLVVLYNLLLQYADMSPLQWLMFTLSAEGGDCIGKVFLDITSNRLHVDATLVNALLSKVAELMEPQSRAASIDVRVPVLLIDELQRLSKWRVSNNGSQISAMNAVVKAAAVLMCPAVWSGTRMGITAAGSPDSSIAKHFSADLGLQVLGDFDYLTPEDVRAHFEATFHHSATPATMTQLCYLLQGRARMLTSFVAQLLIPSGHAMASGELSDDVLREELERYMNTMVVQRFKAEIDSVRAKGLMSDAVLGHVWCKSMLCHYDEQEPEKIDVVHHTNSLAFTSHVEEVSIPQERRADAPENVSYRFDYVFGEPGLQEALLRIVWELPALADVGILEVLRGAWTGSALGTALDHAVALAMLCRRSTVLHDLCTGHPSLSRYADYRLQISRVVVVSTAEQQYDWVSRVLEDPEDCECPLLRGVPVKNIAILPSVNSGADFICVATRADPAVASSTPAPTAEPTAYALSRRKRTRAECNVAAAEAAPTTPDLVFVNVCCATYKGGVTNAKHNKNISLSEHQFLSQKGGVYGQLYNAMMVKNEHKFKYLPVLVEIPRQQDEQTGDYIQVTETNADVLFSASVVNAFESRQYVV